MGVISYIMGWLALWWAATPGAVTPNATPRGVPSPQPISLPSNVFQQSQGGAQHPFIVGLVEWLFIISAAGLIALMSAQTTKSEGLSGTIGGRTESAYRGRIGLDKQLSRLTAVLAIAFILLAIIYFFITR